MTRLTHADRRGRARMVDVSAKPATAREAVARAVVRMRPQTLALVRANRIAKGNVLEVAQLAGVMAAKRTAELIPLCHPIPLTDIQVRAAPAARGVAIEARARTVAPTGVEMEALVAAAVAALAVYDMCKAADRGMTIDRVRLVAKRGGRSGTYRRPGER
ncbi:MAG: cyclic pyranopterin monophosphate synthase MoaC [Armatimonadota bacterium]|nr:cyclic pyranopterin monophosphate synthase MoaC [Armatimonadota bacterium]MDR7421672.1 cyclic pyranopterin monophosphate synthase MoaC [Armatimonadota bacterium]MDR7454611.1 cyclic pyranopterin monophosphate synthase MoaC [Armatimonadota bacterium]MDR7456543.1 cyclic pyranopterin monophosphate synthase MoaC [Armatimonadota bacterium]MDR7495856.1 cyclic pyranopterin monophosphate synthase MoaC [Armatimonadota bacterium]